RPEHKAKEYPEINRRITKEEFDEAVNFAEELGLDLVE
ncbi:MAG: radical SAM protein, partial [Euryarchaeota archaeon CG01_land_8_20_14_3_00_38_12]